MGGIRSFLKKRVRIKQAKNGKVNIGNGRYQGSFLSLVEQFDKGYLAKQLINISPLTCAGPVLRNFRGRSGGS